MATPNRDPSQNKYPEQYMMNTSFDEDFGVNTVEHLGYDGVNLQRMAADALATKITVDGLDDDWQEREIGGLGWHLIKELTDEVTYHSDPQKGNRLMLVKKIKSLLKR